METEGEVSDPATNGDNMVPHMPNRVKIKPAVSDSYTTRHRLRQIRRTGGSLPIVIFPNFPLLHGSRCGFAS